MLMMWIPISRSEDPVASIRLLEWGFCNGFVLRLSSISCMVGRLENFTKHFSFHRIRIGFLQRFRFEIDKYFSHRRSESFSKHFFFIGFVHRVNCR